MFTMIQPYISLCRFDKPIGIYLLLYPVVWALILASNHHLDPIVTGYFVLGVIVMRSLGCVINDIADKDIDPFVERTCKRPLACHQLSVHQAYATASAFAFLALYILMQLPMNCWLYALPAAALTLIYPYCKRWIQCPQLILGMAFSSAIPMVYSAICQTVPPQAWLLCLLSTIWPIIYDTQYALVDKADDKRIGVRSTAIWFGESAYLILSVLQVIFFSGWFAFGYYYQFSTISLIPFLGAIGIALQQQRYLSRGTTTDAFQAFLSNKWLGLLLCLSISFAQWR